MIDIFSMSPELIFHYRRERREFTVINSALQSNVMLLIEKGSFELEMNGEKTTVSANDAVIFPRGVSFRRHVIEPITFELIKFEWSSCYNGEPLSGKMTFFDKKRIANALERLEIISEHTGLADSTYAKLVFSDIWNQYCLERLPFTGAKHHITGDSLINESLKIIETSPELEITVRELSKILGLSEVNFSRRFKAAVGIAPIQYITNLKMRKAATLLLKTEMSIEDVSVLCGFENQFYFANVFKKHFGMPPTSYRKRNMLDDEI